MSAEERGARQAHLTEHRMGQRGVRGTRLNVSISGSVWSGAMGQGWDYDATSDRQCFVFAGYCWDLQIPRLSSSGWVKAQKEDSTLWLAAPRLRWSAAACQTR